MVASWRRVPAWAWLAALVAVSFGVRAFLARDMLGPYVFNDELIYSELARSLAATGDLLIRGVPVGGYGVVYPLLISPAYAIFERLTDAYAAVKTLNALYMSLAAVPAYLLARRVVGPGLSLLAAVLAVSLPSLAYTGFVLTENAFYPIFLAVALLLVLVLERPSTSLQIVLVLALGIAFMTRVQTVLLLPAVLTAPLLLAAFRRESLRAAVATFRWLYALLLGVSAVAVGVQLVRGRPVSDLFGAYGHAAQLRRGDSLNDLYGGEGVVGDTQYEAVEILRFFAYHVAELDLYLGIVPVAATIVLAGRVRSLDRPLQCLLVAALTVGFWLLLGVAAFASVFAQRIEERYMFVAAPLFLVLLLAWVDRGAPRPRVLAPVAAGIAAALVLLIPFERFVGYGAASDTLMLLPWWTVSHHVTLEWVAELAFAMAVVLAAAFQLIPRRYALILPLVVLVYYGAVSQQVWSGRHGVRQASALGVSLGIGVERDWIDALVDGDETVPVLWGGRSDRFVVHQNEFFNRAVGHVYYTEQPTAGGLGETKVEIDPADGVVRLPDGEALEVDYLLTGFTVILDGEVVARDDMLGTTLWRIDGPVVLHTSVSGLYSGDRFSGESVTWTHRRCRGGELWVSLSSDPTIFPEGQTVSAVHGATRVEAQVPPGGTTPLRVPLEDGVKRCIVRFRVSPTAVPSEVVPESRDGRELGARFSAFIYEPAT